MRPLNFHPDRVLARLLRARYIPRWVRPVLQWLVVGVAWYSVLSSTLSIASSAQWVIDASIYTYRFVAAHAPSLAVVLDFVHHLVAIWHALTEPVFQFLFGWWPFEVPHAVLDVLVIVGVLVGGQVRAWFATSTERQFVGALSPSLTKFGRAALLKRVYAAVELMAKADANVENPEESRQMGDRWESELVQALDELTENAGTSANDDRVIDDILTRKGDEIREMLLYIERLEDIERSTKRDFLIRSGAVAGTLLAVLLLDLIYVAVPCGRPA